MLSLWESGHAACRLTTPGVTHTVEVSASTLFEAVTLGLKVIQGHDWVAGLNEQLGAIRVAVTSIPVEHTVKLKGFTAWLGRTLGVFAGIPPYSAVVSTFLAGVMLIGDAGKAAAEPGSSTSVRD